MSKQNTHHTAGVFSGNLHVISRLDYGSAVLVGLPVYVVRYLQLVLNAAARLIYNMRSAAHITDMLISLHWLRTSQQIEYKVAVLMYKVLHGSAPRYLGPLVPVADLQGRQTLHSAGTNCLVVPSDRLSTVGSRAFSVAAPRFWNALPAEMSDVSSVVDVIPSASQDMALQPIVSRSHHLISPLDCQTALFNSSNLEVAMLHKDL